MTTPVPVEPAVPGVPGEAAGTPARGLARGVEQFGKAVRQRPGATLAVAIATFLVVRRLTRRAR
ncbi:hypothetical protein V5P93_004183 [Actinokineospora auranticolor]|uniref:Uncharacterized protein n=1 Tax=Actinokineospora auranticolor TaxID=155976 RepID=A0A2S6GIQ9_9PSEU|nr:hypothetical protein [Actinokineospora auranticolor]PPK65073.1 hypothetical protein CLV40_116116 [Actinokineospora auranticolor]